MLDTTEIQPVELPELLKESAVEIKKQRQKKEILKALFTGGRYFISELSESLLISIPSLTTLLEELQAEGWISGEEIETGKQGRKPTIYFINNEINTNLLIDISVNSQSFYLINFKNEIIHQHEAEVDLADQAQYLEELLVNLRSFLKKVGMAGHQLKSIGISMPGLVNSDKKKNFTYPNIKTGNQGICEKIEKTLKKPCYILNDSKATANGEALYGQGANLTHVLSVNLDWGVGLAMYTDGHVYAGAHGFAGELGHIQVVPDGELCSCGKIGCLDTVTSASSLLKRIKQGLKEGRPSLLSKYKDDLSAVNLEKIIEVVKKGDAFAIDLLYNIGLEIGKGLSIAVHLFNPQIIIIDGILSKAGKFLVNPIEHTINKYCLPDFKADLKIEVTKLGKLARLFGLNAYLANKIFQTD